MTEERDWEYITEECNCCTIPKEYYCKCNGALDFDDGFYICVNPDCDVINIPSTLLGELI